MDIRKLFKRKTNSEIKEEEQEINRLLAQVNNKTYFTSLMFDYVHGYNLFTTDLKPGQEVYIDFFNFNNSFNGWDGGGNILNLIDGGRKYNIMDFFKPFIVESVGLMCMDDLRAEQVITHSFYSDPNLEFLERLVSSDYKLSSRDFTLLLRRGKITNDFFYVGATLKGEEFPKVGPLIDKTFIPVDSPLGKRMEHHFVSERRIRTLKQKIQSYDAKLEKLEKELKTFGLFNL